MEINSELIEIQKGIREGQFTSEAAVSRGVVMRLLRILDWPIFDPNVVFPEFQLENLFVDYALCLRPTKPAIIIEVKSIGRLEGADAKLFEYAFRAGAMIAILTDGQEWHFYLPSGKGSIIERRFYKLDLLQRNIDEIESRFIRYLSYNRVKSGEAFKSAQEEHDSAFKIREIKENIPLAWRRIIQEKDSILIDLISEKVADLCGYKPDPDMVSSFLDEQSGYINLDPAKPIYPPRQDITSTPQGPTIRQTGKFSYTLFGKTTKARSASEIMLLLLNDLDKRDRTFLNRFTSRKHGRRRRYVARNREDLYPGRPDLSEYSKQLSSGWWVGTNYSRSNIKQIIELACEVANINFGQELILDIGG